MDIVLFFILLIMVRVDLVHKRIPDALNFLLLLLAVPRSPWWWRDALLSFGIALSLRVMSGRRLGLGDVKLYSTLAAHLGLEHLFMLYTLSFLSAGLVCVLLVLAKKISPQGEIAFGPFIALAWLVIRWPILLL